MTFKQDLWLAHLKALAFSALAPIVVFNIDATNPSFSGAIHRFGEHPVLAFVMIAVLFFAGLCLSGFLFGNDEHVLSWDLAVSLAVNSICLLGWSWRDDGLVGPPSWLIQLRESGGQALWILMLCASFLTGYFLKWRPPSNRTG